MSYIIVSGDSTNNVLVEVVESEDQVRAAVARAMYGSPEEVTEPEAHRLLCDDLLRDEELRFEDGFVRLYQGAVFVGNSR